MHSSFSVNDVDELKYFLNLSDKGFIDVMILDGRLVLINDSTSFGYLAYKSSGDATDVSFRVSRSLFSKLVINGTIEFEINDTISCTIYKGNGKKFVQFSFVKQEVFTSIFADKIKCLSRLKDAVFVDMSRLGALLQIAKGYQSIISFSNGYASTKLPGRGKIFERFESEVNFAVQSQALARLLSQSSRLFSIESYLGISVHGLSVLHPKSVMDDNEDFYYLDEQKSAFICDLDIETLLQVINSLKPKCDSITMDLVLGNALINEGGNLISIPLDVSNVQCSMGYKLKTFDLSIILISGVFSKIKKTKYCFKKKKNCMEFFQDDIFIFI